MYIDKPTQEKIDIAHPSLRKELSEIVTVLNRDILTGRAKVRITFTLRTMEEQDALYAQGRESLSEVNKKRSIAKLQPISASENKKVTNAKAGDSFHNYALACDIVLIIDGKTASWDTKADWDGDKQSDWMEVVVLFKKYGWKWGGDWTSFKDMPHFEKTFNNTISTLKSKYSNKQFISGTTYVRV